MRTLLRFHQYHDQSDRTKLSLRGSNLIVPGLARRERCEAVTVRLEIDEGRAVQAVKTTHKNIFTIDA